MKNAAVITEKYKKLQGSLWIDTQKFVFINHRSMSEVVARVAVVLEHSVSFVKQIGLQYPQTWITSIFDALMSRALVRIASSSGYV